MVVGKNAWVFRHHRDRSVLEAAPDMKQAMRIQKWAQQHQLTRLRQSSFKADGMYIILKDEFLSG